MFGRFSARFARLARTNIARSIPRTLPIVVATTAATAVALTTSTIFAAAAPAPAPGGGRLPPHGVPGSNTERTFIAIKPDGVQRGLIAKIIARFEEKGFQLVAMKLIVPTLDEAKGHYDDLKSKPFFPSLTRFFSSGPVIAMVWQGKGVILTGRRLLGETDPAKSAPGSIRGDYSVDIGRNIIHGSDGAEGAQHEINFWFTPEE